MTACPQCPKGHLVSDWLTGNVVCVRCGYESDET